jgi:uncharacterized DUF497 family protein
MNIEFDSTKSEKNRLGRGLPFECVIDFEWETALYSEDVRQLYSERRFVAIGYLNERLHVLCFTPISNGVRVISFRKANLREIKRYENETVNR